MMGWDEILQPGVPKDIVIQSWRGRESFFESIKKGYQAILSHGYYIDLIQHADTHYLNDPIPDSVHLTPAETKLVLGGEATMWSELITPETVDSRIWPRLAAIAERLWSPREINDLPDMYRRMDIISRHLETLGLKHLSYRPPLFRRLANSTDYKAVEVLVDVIEPLKIYERNSGDTMYTVFSPFTKIADVAIPDPEMPRMFDSWVEEYLDKRTPAIEKKITGQLTLWRDNHQEFLKTLKNSPILKEAEILSENLSRIGKAGLEAMQYIRNGNTAGKGWSDENLNVLENAKQSGGRCELQVITPVQKLVTAAGGEGVMLSSFKNLCLVR
jgi:hexosaminidase